MTGNEYQKLAMRTNDGNSTERIQRAVIGIGAPECYKPIADIGGLFNGCLGLSGEVGEFNDMIKKWIFHEKDLDIEHAKKELSDCLWYVAMICESFGWRLDEIMQINIDKLKARYPQGFDVELANHRKQGDV